MVLFYVYYIPYCIINEQYIIHNSCKETSWLYRPWKITIVDINKTWSFILLWLNYFFTVEALLFSGLRQDYFFCNISKQKNFFNVQAGPNYFFGPKAAPDYFFKKSSSPPPPDNEMVAPLVVETVYVVLEHTIACVVGLYRGIYWIRGLKRHCFLSNALLCLVARRHTRNCWNHWQIRSPNIKKKNCQSLCWRRIQYMMAEDKHLPFEKLCGQENWAIWSDAMQTYLEAINCWKIMKGYY